ncbi:uncharacterized protein [Clytia hemisphaerica]|uniref:SEA domain-containing protein n=1 Tax=Clytia hemisphaerica TaxID=252671 RepID=A0A7M5WW82_9CNID
MQGSLQWEKFQLAYLLVALSSTAVPRVTGTAQRIELDCTKIYEAQRIGVLEEDWNRSPDLINIINQQFVTFEPFGCKGRIVSVKPPNSSLKLIGSEGTIKGTYNFKDGKLSVGDVLIFDVGDNLAPVNNGIETIVTPGQGLKPMPDANVGVIPLPPLFSNRSVKIELMVQVGYNCTAWTNDTFCYPPQIGSNVGVTISNRTCTRVVDTFNNTVQVQTTPCNASFEWKSWSDWSKCEPINATESLYGNGTKYRENEDCEDGNGERVDDYWCGGSETIYHLRSCYVFNESEYKYSDYTWSEMSECQIYRPELQGVTETNEQCGNGFQYSNQTYCTMGEYQEYPPQNQSLCPPSGYFMKFCYKPCKEMRSFYSKAISNDQFEIYKPNTVEDWEVRNFTEKFFKEEEKSSLWVLMKFHPYDPENLRFSGKELKASGIVSKEIELQIFFSRFIHLRSFQIEFSEIEKLTYIDATTYVSTDLVTWRNITQKERKVIAHRIESLRMMNAVLEVHQTIIGLKMTLESNATTPRLKATLNELSYNELGDWTEWGSWGDCSGNCRLKNSTYERTRTCSQRDHPKYCVGKFVEKDTCKCKEDFQWKHVNTTFGPCNATKDECGPGWRYKTPNVCQYIIDGSSHPEELCGDKPVIAQNCFEVCSGHCNQAMAMGMKSPINYANSNSVTQQLENYKEDIFVSMSDICLANLKTSLKMEALIKVGYFQLMDNCSDTNYHRIANATFIIPDPFLLIPYCSAPKWTWVDEPCSVTCGNGSFIRYPRCKNTDETVEYPEHYCLFEENLVNMTLNCTNNVSCYELTQWTNFSSCGGECGINGTQNQTRECLRDGEPIANHAECITLGNMTTDIVFFNSSWCYNLDEPCTRWGAWSNWTHNSEKCGNYTETSERECFTDKGATSATSKIHLENLPSEDIWVVSSTIDPCKDIEDQSSEGSGHPIILDEGIFAGSPLFSENGISRSRMIYTNTSCYKWDVWKPYGACSVTCGKGIKKLKRDCLDTNGEKVDIKHCDGLDPQLKENSTEACDLGFSCGDPVTKWSEWSLCSRSCNGGQLTRTRECMSKDIDVCKSFALIDQKPCNPQRCKVDGRWSDWSNYTECSVSCGNGNQFRNRTCFPPQHGGLECTGVDVEVKNCLTAKVCPVVLMKAMNCTKACETIGENLVCGSEFFKGFTPMEMAAKTGLYCTNFTDFDEERPHPSYDRLTQICKGFKNIGSYDCSMEPKENEERICGCVGKDEVTMGPWSQWGECSTTCGPGVQKRSRNQVSTVDISETESFTHTKPCNDRNCPMDGNWGQWSGFGRCSVSCGKGEKVRMRECNDPTPMFDGRDCSGQNTDSMPCGFPEICPVNGGWSDWIPYSNCSQPCQQKNSTEKIYRSFIRRCDSPLPEFGGEPCEGSIHLYEPCENLTECTSVNVDVNVKVTDRLYTDEYEDLQSDASLDIQNQIQEFVNTLYNDRLAKDKQYVKVVMHSLTNGTGVEGVNLFDVKEKKPIKP